MKQIFVIILVLFCLSSNAQIANAGLDKTIYLTQTYTATLDGSASSGSSFLWTEISTDYMSGATITSPTSKITTVTGLPQGVFYFQLAATSGGITKMDSMKVIVDYAPPPKNSKIWVLFPIHNPDFVWRANLRDDTTRYIGYNEGPPYKHSRWYINGKQQGFIERGRLQNVMVDRLRGKLYNTIQDGQPMGNSLGVVGAYCRSQINLTDTYRPDTNKTYVINWKFYFPQNIRDVMSPTPYWGRVTMLDIHGNDDESGQFGTILARDSFMISDRIKQANGKYISKEIKLLDNDDYYNKTNTIRITYREGSNYPGQKAFIKVELNGVVKYYRNKGQVGKTLGEDYIKICGLYDYRNLLTDANNLTRNKKVSLVTMDGTIFELNAKPTVNAGENQNLTSSSTTNLNGSANDEGVSGNGRIVSYEWTKLLGGPVTITNPTSSSTTVTGLERGVYTFRLKATDDSGLVGYDTLQINNL